MYWFTQGPSKHFAHYDPFQTPQQSKQQSSQGIKTPSMPAPAELAIRNGSKKRRACNECKQQKLRCDLSTLIHRTSETCSRCTRLGFECRIDRSFKRERKRKRSDELEKEVDSLRKELSRRSTSLQATSDQFGAYSEQNLTHQADNIESDSTSTSSTYNFHDVSEVFSSPYLSIATPGSIERSYTLVGTTACYPDLVPISFGDDNEVYDNKTPTENGTRSLGQLQLASEEINELFSQYFIHYHPFLPILDPALSPTDYHNQSIFLFWVIISIGSRRFERNPTLNTVLGEIVTKLTWDTLQSIPSSKSVIQGLAILCTWPFPTTTSGTDVSYVWAGTMASLAIQIGLHRPYCSSVNQRDQNPIQSEETERAKIWAACNIVTQRVSVGAGLAAPILHDWNSILSSQYLLLDINLELFLKLEAFRDNVTRTAAPNGSDLGGPLDARERSFLYNGFMTELMTIEEKYAERSDIGHFYILAARLHLQSFCLLGEPASDSYTERVLDLYSSAVGIIQHTLDMDRRSHSVIWNGPFSDLQVVISAAFVVLKVIRNDYFASFIDLDAGRRTFQYSINAIKNMSINNNDNASRMADILTFVWTDVSQYPFSTRGKEGLQLRVRSRMSMSIIYDCLQHWQESMQTHLHDIDGFREENCDPELFLSLAGNPTFTAPSSFGLHPVVHESLDWVTPI